MELHEIDSLMNLFFDLDGTLLNSKPRLYHLFQYLVPSSTFTFDEYWQLKKDKINHRTILLRHFNYNEDEISRFEREWMTRIEDPQWLKFDAPIDGVTDFLKQLKPRHNIYLVTARQFEHELLHQIKQYGWEGLFNGIFVTAQKNQKHELIERGVVTSNKDWFVGDTGKDIETGKILGIRTAAVLTGFLSKARLSEYNPDIIIDSVLDLEFDKQSL
jgi:phosphoglycolate phosphatase